MYATDNTASRSSGHKQNCVSNMRSLQLKHSAQRGTLEQRWEQEQYAELKLLSTLTERTYAPLPSGMQCRHRFCDASRASGCLRIMFYAAKLSLKNLKITSSTAYLWTVHRDKTVARCYDHMSRGTRTTCRIKFGLIPWVYSPVVTTACKICAVSPKILFSS